MAIEILYNGNFFLVVWGSRSSHVLSTANGIQRRNGAASLFRALCSQCPATARTTAWAGLATAAAGTTASGSVTAHATRSETFLDCLDISDSSGRPEKGHLVGTPRGEMDLDASSFDVQMVAVAPCCILFQVVALPVFS